MNVSLTPELERYIDDQVASGMYHSASEVVREGLRVLIDRQEDREAKLDALRRDINVAREQIDRGEARPLDRRALRERGLRHLGERS